MASAPRGQITDFEEDFNRLLAAVDELRVPDDTMPDGKWQALTQSAWDLYNDLPPHLFWEWLDLEFEAGRVLGDLFKFTQEFFRIIEKGAEETSFQGTQSEIPKSSSDEPEGQTPQEFAEQSIRECLSIGSIKLDLSKLGLTELPEAIGELTHLEHLALDNNRLTVLPEAIGKLTKLKMLDLDSNRLTDLPETIGNLTNLRALFASRNRLENLPTAIGALTNLTTLNLHHNELEKLPPSVGELLSLAKLRLEDNKLQSLPVVLANMPKLGNIRVGQGEISPDSLLEDGWPEEALNRVNFEDALEDEGKGDEATQPINKKQPPLRTHSDTATDEDQLGRAPAAEALAARLNLIWRRHAKDQHTDPLVMHLNAPWGSGKSSYFLLLRKFLKNPSMPIYGEDNSGDNKINATQPESWAVVQMNAWQHQHVGAPWWSLFQIIFDQIRVQTCTPSAEYRMTWQETWRRFHGRKLHVFVSLGVTALGLTVLFGGGSGSDILDILLGKSVNSSVGAAAFTQVFLGIPVAATGIFKSVNYFRETLLPGDAATAERWTSIQKDPRNRLKEHFRGLVDDLDKPLLVFIDDLDRCQPKYVVELLEHIMTIFRHSKVFFLVAADGQWITRCFELEYRDFKDYHSDPGRSLGHHFLEKVFQFSIPLPQVSKELRDAYWALLTEPDLEATVPRSRDPDHIIKLFWAFRHILAHDFRKFLRFILGKTTEKKRQMIPSWLLALITAEVGDVPELAPQEKSERQKRLDDLNKKSSKATAAYANEDTEERIQSFLGPFSELVENNPRAMKRLVNAYIVQAIAETARHGRELDEDEEVRLARWTILQHRYPILIDYFRNNPHKIRPVIDHVAGTDTTAFEDDKRVQAILEQENKITHILTSPRTGHPIPIVLESGQIADYLAIEIGEN